MWNNGTPAQTKVLAINDKDRTCYYYNVHRGGLPLQVMKVKLTLSPFYPTVYDSNGTTYINGTTSTASYYTDGLAAGTYY